MDGVENSRPVQANSNLSLLGVMNDGKTPPLKPTNFDLADFLECVPDRLHISHGKDFEITPKMLKAVESTDLTPYEKMMLEVAESNFDALSHLNSPSKRHAKNKADAVSTGVRADLYGTDPGEGGGHQSKSAMWNRFSGITEDDIRSLRVLDLDRIRLDNVVVCSAKGRGKGAILGTVGEVAFLTAGGPLAWTSTGLTTGFDMMRSHGSPGMRGLNRGGALGAQLGQKMATGGCAKQYDKEELPKIKALIASLDAEDFDTLEDKADKGDPEAMFRYGKSLKASGDYRTVNDIASEQNHRDDRAGLRLGGEQAQLRAAQLGSATAKFENAKILIKSVDEKDQQLALDYFETAVKANCRGAKAEYGRVLVAMGSDNADSERVFKGLSLLESAAKAGDLVALGQLRTVYAQGVSARGQQDAWILPPNPTRVAEVDNYLNNLPPTNPTNTSVSVGGD